MHIAPRLIAALRQGRFLHARRVVGWCGVLFAVELAAALFVTLGTYGLIVPVRPTTTDFSSFYAAGRLALGADPSRVYDQAAHWAAQQAATTAGVEHDVFYYPPVFLLLCAPLARLPYLLAFAVFQALGLALYLPVARRSLGLPGAAGLLPALAFPAMIWSVGIGQNALLTAAILGGGLLLLEHRPWLAGAALGLLAYKPHFGLLLPVALAAGRHWRAFAAAALSVAGLTALSAAVFGLATWQAWFHAFAGSGSVYATGKVSFAAMVTPFGAARLLGATNALAMSLQAAVLLLCVVLVALVWRGRAPFAARAAVLLAAVPLAAPLALFYDMMPVGLAIFWLARRGRQDGFLPWERLTLAGAYFAPLLSRHLGLGLHLPLGQLAILAVLSFAVRHARASYPRARIAETPSSAQPSISSVPPVGAIGPRCTPPRASA